MFLPAEYLWAEPVLIAALVVFIVAYISNSITFFNRFLNALVTALVFAGIFGALAFYGYGNITMTVRTTPAANAPADTLMQGNSP